MSQRDTNILLRLPLVVSIILWSYGLFVLGSVGVSYVHAQQMTHDEATDITMSELSRRLNKIEDEHLEVRLVALETIQKDSESAAYMARINTGVNALVLLGFGAQAYHARTLMKKYRLESPIKRYEEGE